MTRRPADLSALEFDLLVVGGGIHGVAAAYDAAQRGLRVALLERGDLGGASSFNHLKTVHGGLRSLQTGNLARFREGILERRTLAHIAPHLVEPLPFLLPTLPRTLTRGRPALTAALLVDAVLGADRNRGLAPHLHLPAGRVVGRDEALRLCPALAATPASGGALWYDYQMPRTDRLTLAFAHAAAACGAVLATYVAADGPLVERGRALGVRARVLPTGDELVVRARVTLNAAGAWAGRFAAALGAPMRSLLQKALNVVTSRRHEGPALGAPGGTGTLFMVPWQGRLMVGTWHETTACDPEALDVSADELGRFLADANAAFPWLGVRSEEITLVHRGIVPAVAAGGERVAMRTHSAVVDHARDGIEGAVTIVGVKYTTGRRVAERAVDLVCRKLGGSAPPGRTAVTPLPGATTEVTALARDIEARLPSHDPAVARHLVESYGSRVHAVIEAAGDRAGWLERLTPAHPAIGAEVIHAVRAELATTLTDVVVRRTQLGAAGHPGDPAALAAAQVMGSECGWDGRRVGLELEELRRFYLPVTRDADPGITAP